MDFLEWDNLNLRRLTGDGSSGAVLNLLTGKAMNLRRKWIDDALRFIKRSSRLFKETGDMK